MSVVIPIDSVKITEVLFENSELVNSEVYLRIMNLMKQYHDHENNHEEIINYINTLQNKELKTKIKKYITKKKESRCCRNIYLVMCLICAGIPFFGILSGFIYVIVTK